MENAFSVERQAFNDEISRLKGKDEESVKLAEEAKTMISEMENAFSVELQALNDEINRLKGKDEESVKLAEEEKTMISEMEISVILPEQPSQRSRCVEIVPREKRIRKCNSNK